MAEIDARDQGWQCTACEAMVEVVPCPYCGHPEVNILWSDGQNDDVTNHPETWAKHDG